MPSRTGHNAAPAVKSSNAWTVVQRGVKPSSVRMRVVSSPAAEIEIVGVPQRPAKASALSSRVAGRTVASDDYRTVVCIPGGFLDRQTVRDPPAVQE